MHWKVFNFQNWPLNKFSAPQEKVCHKGFQTLTFLSFCHPNADLGLLIIKAPLNIKRF